MNRRDLFKVLPVIAAFPIVAKATESNVAIMKAMDFGPPPTVVKTEPEFKFATAHENPGSLVYDLLSDSLVQMPLL